MGALSRASALAALIGLVAATPAVATLRNGDFAEGAGAAPAGWRQEAWAADGSRFAWERERDGTGVARITNVTPNDARLCQSVAVEPGATYRVSARVRTADVGAETAGALIAIEPRVADSPDLRGTQPWRRLEVLADAGERTRWDVCVRLGSYANLNTGTAWFTDVALTRVRGPSARWPGAGVLARWRPAVPDGAAATAAPLAGGLMAAWGLGVLRRRRP